MKAYTKTNIGLKHLKHTVISRALQYTFLALSVTGYAHAQQAGTESAKPDTKGKPVAPSVLEAQESNPKPTNAGGAAVLPTVIVKDTGHIPGYVTTRTLSATKTDTPIIEVPQSISVVNRNEMDIRAVNLNITEALRYVPGVTVDQFGFNGTGFEYLGMRGFNVQTTANFRDNLNQAATGLYFGAFITDPYALERVEVLRGPTSVTFGRGDAGGIVNRITKLPSATPVREFEIQYGNFDRKRVAADFGLTNADGTLMFRLVTSALDQDTQVRFTNTNGDRASIRRFYIAPSLTWRPSDRTSITLFGDILNNRSGAAAFYSAAPDLITPTNTLISDPAFTRYSTNQASFSYKIEHHFNEIWTARQNFRFQRQDGNFRDINPAGFAVDPITGNPTSILDRSAFATKERLDQTTLDTHLQARFDTGPIKHTTLFGIDWNRMNASLNYFASTSLTPSIDVFNPVYFQPIPTPDFLAVDAKQKIDNVGFYIQDQVKYQNWILTLSGRHDKVSNNTSDVVSGDVFRNKDSAYTGRAGLTYLFSNGIAPYFSYSQSFLPQPGIDRNGDGRPFDPTRASQYEVGVKYQPVGSRALFTVALFELTKTNVLTPDLRAGGVLSQTGEIRSRGAEVEARAEIFRGLNAIGAFTYNDVKVTKSEDGFEGNMPIRVPNTTTSGWLDYNFSALNISWLKGFGIGGGVRYVGRVYNDDANTSTTRSFTLFDAVLRYDHGPWRFFINANNIFNQHYFSASSGGNFFRGTDRVVVGTLKLNF
ncbi:iron complex outermembrane recepter protein [Nitrosospira multiformis]|uniref:Iron complex outermembrane recepter protein n=1 Tax=Nitrosospira multiformis TaxID=1231 RepID=A0ABY0TCE3_9PROT|nr:TonB-dependent siderophore receptor [Nitrosospira multiformis]SDQ61497.1 iron complex outermembrane recepter protein [Nitrosospira multiformis]